MENNHRKGKKPDTKNSTLYVSMDTANAQTCKTSYQLAGSTTGALAAIALRADDGEIKIDSLTIYVSATAPASIFESLMLTDSKGNVVAKNSNVDSVTVIKNIGSVGGQTKTIYLQAVLHKIGRDEVGQLDAVAIFQVGGIFAIGNKKIAKIVYENDAKFTKTNPSAKMKVVAARVSSVGLVDANGTVAVSSTITEGWCNAAIIKIMTDNSFNTEQSGDLIRIILDKVRVNIQENSGMTITEVQIGRVKSSGMTFLSTAYSATVEFDMTQSAIGDDEEIDPSVSAYYLVKLNVSALDKNNENWIQVSLSSLNGDVNSSNFIWRDGDDASPKSTLRLPYDILAGTKIIEQ